MKASIIAASVALVGAAAAYEHKRHGDLHLRRAAYKQEKVCTVYETVYVTAMPSPAPNTTWVAPPEAPKTTTLSKQVPVYTPVAPPANPAQSPKPSPPPAQVYPPAPPKESPPAMVYPPAPPKVESSVAVPVYSQVPAPSKPAAPTNSQTPDKPKQPSGSYSSGGRIKTNGNKWSITYTPYANDGQCKSQGEIEGDIKKISEMGFTTIRSYSTDCGVFSYVVPACQKYGLKVIYGIFLEAGGKGPFSDHANQQLQEIKDKAPKDSVAMVIVGNECMFNGNCEATQLASYIDHVRKELRGCGFPSDIAVTTTEPVGTWEQQGAALCDHIDVFAVQIHPYFTASISADMAGDFAAQQLEQAKKVCPAAAAKGAYITEIGWPAQGTSNGKAVAGTAEQRIAIKKIQEKVGAEACLFSYQNDGWKHPGALGVEQFFGCTDALSS